MIPLQSAIENIKLFYADIRQDLSTYQFSLGGNWDYDHGYFDRGLDEANKVWLRIPFQVVNGVLDADREDTKTEIKLGKPFVLKHIYNEGLDPEARYMTYGGLLDQFQDPLEKDADVEEEWIQKAAALLKQVEQRILR